MDLFHAYNWQDDNLFFRAFWTRLRHDTRLRTAADFCRELNDTVFNKTHQLDTRLLLLEALKWAKTWGMGLKVGTESMFEVATPPTAEGQVLTSTSGYSMSHLHLKVVSGDVRERTLVLKRLLVSCTEYISREKEATAGHEYRELWTGFYAPLLEYVHTLRVEAGAAEGVMMDSGIIRRVLASIGSGPDANWPVYIRQLYNVLKERGQASDIDDLWNNRELQPLLLAGNDR